MTNTETGPSDDPTVSPGGPAPTGFEERLQELETLSERLKDGEVPLAEAVDLFERGMNLARELSSELARIERRIEIMINEPELTDQPPKLEEFTDDQPDLPRDEDPEEDISF